MTTSDMLRLVAADALGVIQRYQKLQQIATALSAEADLAHLLDTILRESRALTNADSGSVYVREDLVEARADATGRDTSLHRVTSHLVLRITQNDSLSFPFKTLRLPIDRATIAGHVAVSGETVNIADAYNLPEGVPYTYNRDFDGISGYRCKSMLVVPMRNRAGDVIGAIQLINKKEDPHARLLAAGDVEREVRTFDSMDEELATALGSQAAVCVEKAKLYEDIEAMFEGLVGSFTNALERRNRTTYGHCLRVAGYAVAIAEAINQSDAFGGVRFTPDQLKELRYAALLHDIGKMAVPEAVLDKRNKLTEAEVEAIAWRFSYARERLAREGRPADHLAGWLEHIRRVNIPVGTTDEDVRLLHTIAAATFADPEGRERPLLAERELENLAITRGNLTPAERRQIEQHIVGTWEMLRRVPWPAFLRGVPRIAACHHEKTNGTGYPWQLRGDEIPLGGRILAIVDIYEALTAKDRPYKPAMSHEKALAILDEEAARGAIDASVYRLFKDRRIYTMFEDNTGHIRRPAE